MGVYSLAQRLARVSGIFSSLILLLLVLIGVTSIVGRRLFASPIPGDLEFMQLGAALAAPYAFAWCHFMRSDIQVNIATARLSVTLQRLLDRLGNLGIAVMSGLLAWRTGVLASEARMYEEATAILAIPVWIAQAGMVPGLALWCLVAALLFVARQGSPT